MHTPTYPLRVFCPVCGGRRFVPSARIRPHFPDLTAPVCEDCRIASPRGEWRDDPEAPGTRDAWAKETPVQDDPFAD